MWPTGCSTPGSGWREAGGAMKTDDDLGGVAREGADSGSALPGVMPIEGSGATLVPLPGEAPARSQWQLFLRRFLHHKLAIASLLVLLAMYTMVALANHLAFYKLNPSPLPLGEAYH